MTTNCLLELFEQVCEEQLEMCESRALDLHNYRDREKWLTAQEAICELRRGFRAQVKQQIRIAAWKTRRAA